MVALLTLVFFGSLFLFRNWNVIKELRQCHFSFEDLKRFSISHILGLIVFFLSTAGAGKFLIHFLPVSEIPFAIKLILAFALGSGAFGIYLLLIAFLGGLNRFWVALFLVPSVLAGLGAVARSKIFLGFQWPALSSVQIIFCGFIVWGLANSFLQSFYPSTDVDALSYHLALPKIWSQSKKMVNAPSLFHTCFPLFIALFNAGAILFRMDTVCQAIHWLYGAMTTLLLIFWDGGPLSLTARLFAATCFATMPVVSHSLSTARNDISWAFYAFLSAYLTLNDSIDPSARVLLAGIFGGLAGSSRFQGLLISFAIGLAGLLTHRLGIKNLVVYEGLVTLISSPWYIRNWIWTGNPFWPLFYSVFHRSNSGSNFYKKHTALFRRNPFDIGQWFDFPISQLWRPTVVHEAAHYFLIPLLWMAIAGPHFWERPDFIFLGLVCLFYTPMNLTLEEIWWRFQTGIIPAGCLLIGWLFDETHAHFSPSVTSVSWIAWIVFVPSLFERFRMTPLTLCGVRINGADGENAREQFLHKYLNLYPIADWINKNLPSDAKVFLFRENRGYYLDRDYLQGNPTHQEVVDYDQFSDFNQLYERLKDCGVTHLLMNEEPVPVSKNGLPLIEENVLRMVDDLVRERCLPVQSMNKFRLYQFAK